MKSNGTTLHVVARVAVAVVAVALIIGTGVPQFQSDEWWVRLFDFPRIQIAIMLALTLSAYVALRWRGSLQRVEHLLAALVALTLGWQCITLGPYTALHPKEMPDSQTNDTSNRISLLIYNVLSDNRDVAALQELIRDTDPDIILLSEPTQRWLDELTGLEVDYPYTVFQPQDNEYGKLLYSRLELTEAEVRFMIEPGVPSVRLKLRLRSGQLVTLYGVHPRPPGLIEEGRRHSEGEREDSDVRDAELLLVAQEVGALGDTPVIVTGDFNDVPWSHTTSLFQRVGGLLDPRVGRGFFNTFTTSTRLVRYPLDHLFASRHFRLVALRRLHDIGSDHFPLLVILDYDPDPSEPNEEPRPKSGDQQAADKAVDKGKAND